MSNRHDSVDDPPVGLTDLADANGYDCLAFEKVQHGFVRNGRVNIRNYQSFIVRYIDDLNFTLSLIVTSLSSYSTIDLSER